MDCQVYFKDSGTIDILASRHSLSPPYAVPYEGEGQREPHVVAHRDPPAVHAVVLAIDAAMGDDVACAGRRVAGGGLDAEALAPLYAADAQDPAQLAALAQQPGVVGVGEDFHLRPLLRKIGRASCRERVGQYV